MANDRTYRPEQIADQLGLSGKIVRAYLRQNFTRAPEAKGTTWVLTADQAKQTREHFLARRAIAKAALEAGASDATVIEA